MRCEDLIYSPCFVSYIICIKAYSISEKLAVVSDYLTMILNVEIRKFVATRFED